MELLSKALKEDLTELHLSKMAQKSLAASHSLRTVRGLVEESRHSCSDVGISGFSRIANLRAAGFPSELPGCKTR